MGKLQNRTKLLDYWIKLQNFVCMVFKIVKAGVSNALELNGSLILKTRCIVVF